mgnify:FL=1
MGRDKSLDDEFCAYGTPIEGLPDPVARSFESLRNQLNILGQRVIQLESELSNKNIKLNDKEEEKIANSNK